ncbi:MAG: AIR synthase-related protein [Desulfobacteraceae bacterium]
MISCIEVALQPELVDAEAESLRKKAFEYFNIKTSDVRSVNLVTIEADFELHDLERIKDEILTNPVIHISSLTPLDIDFDWCLWIGLRPGVKDNPASTAVEAIEDLLGRKFKAEEGVYTSKRYCIKGAHLNQPDIEKLATELLSNPIIQQWRVMSKEDWDRQTGAGSTAARVVINHDPEFKTISIASNEELKQISDQRNLALNPSDIPVIRAYFLDRNVLADRKKVGLCDPTDVELEYISQARSDHCNHNTFRGIFRYHDVAAQERSVENSLFKTFIQEPTLALKEKKPWVVSVLWDNAGIGRFDEAYNYVITGETHNSPSNMEAYGGAITGIVGVYRDPMGTGLGSRLIMGSFGFCVGDINYKGPLKPPLHPRRLLDGVVEGVRDGGNKSGVPTTFGQTLFHPGYMGKSLVFVTALGIMPSKIKGDLSHKKEASPGEFIVMSGGRVGKDGIHGVTASSESYSAHTPAGHVQIGDPYTQKKMHDFLLEARDEGLYQFITDNGGGGLSSSVGESALISNGCEVWLDRVPLKYEGLDMWEIWISESQERMTLSVKPEDIDRFMALSEKHEVESTVIGKYTDTGKLCIMYNKQICACVDMDLMDKGFPDWEFDATWLSPELRGLTEPVLGPVRDFHGLLCDMLSRPNICSKEWIIRQYDHEVQGGSVIKPLVGVHRNIPSNASVIRPVLDSRKGLAFSQALLPWYSKIDAFHMMTCTIDEAVRRILSVGGRLDTIGGVDNFCWPDIQFDRVKNPDGKFKAAQLVRACRALKAACLAYEIPLLSGKDSMYVDGHLPGKYGESIKISALETVQFSATSVIDDVAKCISMAPVHSRDLVYILGLTGNELGGSEYYDLLGKTGLNVPEVGFNSFKVMYKILEKAIDMEIVASAHAVARGGLGVHLALTAMAGGLGLEMDLSKVPADDSRGPLDNAGILFSESAGRFIVSIIPENQALFEKLFKGVPCSRAGKLTDEHANMKIKGLNREELADIPIETLESAFSKPLGDMV